jgi:tRNA threonylcarbamoyladenosine biosynthesis protein TsaB
LWVAVDARMDEIYAGAYRFVQGQWQAQLPPALFTLAALHGAWEAAPPSAVAGSALAAFAERLHTGAARRLDDDGDARAPALAALARTAWQHGQAVDAAQALPLYLRDKVALTTAERAAAKVIS